MKYLRRDEVKLKVLLAYSFNAAMLRNLGGGILIGALPSCLQSRIRKTQKKRDKCSGISFFEADQRLKLRVVPVHFSIGTV